MISIKLSKSSLKKYDGVLICTDHDSINYKLIYNSASKIFDARNVYKFSSKKLIIV